MDKQTKVLIAILAIFVIGMTMSVAFAEPVSAKSYKYKGKKTITCKIKDKKSHKKVKVKCHYRKNVRTYVGYNSKGSGYEVHYFKENGKMHSIIYKGGKATGKHWYFIRKVPITRFTIY